MKHEVAPQALKAVGQLAEVVEGEQEAGPIEQALLAEPGDTGQAASEIVVDLQQPAPGGGDVQAMEGDRVVLEAGKISRLCPEAEIGLHYVASTFSGQMKDLGEEVSTDVEPDLIAQSNHHFLDRFQMSLAFCAQEDTQNPYRLQSRLFGRAAALAFVDQDAPKPELQSESNGGRLSAS